MFVTAFNSSDSAIEVDDLGHTIGAGEYGTADTKNAGTKAAVEAGTLQTFPDGIADVDGTNPAAAAADVRTNELHNRSLDAQKLDKPTLVKLLGYGDLDSNEQPHKDDLVVEAAYSDVELSRKAAKEADKKESP